MGLKLLFASFLLLSGVIDGLRVLQDNGAYYYYNTEPVNHKL